MSNKIYDIPVRRIDGEETSLSDYAGKALLIVNVASKCGLTKQYEGLEKLYREFKDQGLEVLGFPANNFLAQEPGTSDEIQEFCNTNYHVTFPLFEKISVRGDDQHLLYSHLTDAKGKADINNGIAFQDRLAAIDQIREKDSDILWNFEKFFVAKDGTVAARIAPDVTVDDPRVVEAIRSELGEAQSLLQG